MGHAAYPRAADGRRRFPVQRNASRVAGASGADGRQSREHRRARRATRRRGAGRKTAFRQLLRRIRCVDRREPRPRQTDSQGTAVSAPLIRGSHLGGSPGLPPLIVGPSLGTSVTALWSAVARRLAGVYHIIGWDLPGHGASPRPKSAFTIEGLAASVIKLAEDTIGRR